MEENKLGVDKKLHDLFLHIDQLKSERELLSNERADRSNDLIKAVTNYLLKLKQPPETLWWHESVDDYNGYNAGITWDGEKLYALYNNEPFNEDADEPEVILGLPKDRRYAYAAKLEDFMSYIASKEKEKNDTLRADINTIINGIEIIDLKPALHNGVYPSKVN